MKPGGGAGSFEASISVAGTIFHEFMHSQEVKTKTTPNSTPEEKCAHWENHASIHDRTSNFYEMVKASQQCLGVNGKEAHLQKLIDGAQANKAKFEALMVKNGC